LILKDETFSQVFDREAEGDSILRAAALMIELAGGWNEGRKLMTQYPDYRVHMVTMVECFISNSGNVTWIAFDEDGEVIYLRNAHKELLSEAGLWEKLQAIPVGATADAQIEIHTTKDGDFRKPVQIGEICSISVQKTAVQEQAEHELNAIQWADELVAAGNFVVLDTETTSLEGYPVQIAVVDAQGETLFDRLIKPPEGIEIDAGAEKVHGISMEMVKDAPEFDAIVGELNRVIDGKTVVAYNADFDKGVIGRACLKYGLPKSAGNGHEYDCAMLKFAEFVGEIGRKGDYKWQTLESAARALGVTVLGDKAHNAVGDCRFTLEVVKALAGKAKSSEPMAADAPF
jgi:DNA polymerase-3 subunit epsilon